MEIRTLKGQNIRLELEGINARNAFRYIKETLKDMTDYRVEVGWATLLHGHSELAKCISVQRWNRIARAISHAYKEIVKEDEDSGGSTPEQHSDDDFGSAVSLAWGMWSQPDCIADESVMVAGAVWACAAQRSWHAASLSDANF